MRRSLFAVHREELRKDFGARLLYPEYAGTYLNDLGAAK